jgi:hypothetical protein
MVKHKTAKTCGVLHTAEYEINLTLFSSLSNTFLAPKPPALKGKFCDWEINRLNSGQKQIPPNLCRARPGQAIK